MANQDDRDALLVVVGTKAEASAVEFALSVRGIGTRADRDVAGVIEFAGKLGVNPCAVYVHRADLDRAKKILVAKRLPDSARELHAEPFFGM